MLASVLLRNSRIVQGVGSVNIFSVRFPEAFYCFIVAKKSWELGLNGFTSFSKPPRPLLAWSKQSLSALPSFFEWLSCCFVFSSHYSVPTYFVMTLQLKIDLSSHKKDEDFVTGNAYLYDITGSLSKAVVGCSPKYM